jgi:thioredoxin-related protein
MKFFSLAFLAIFIINGKWETDLEKARQRAHEEHKIILLGFSGSDWCVPCIRLHKELLETTEFQQFADSNLVLIQADFPRLKKNQLSREQQKKNEGLADKYNPQGNFPLTLLLDEDGKVLKAWEGFIDLSPQKFIEQVKIVKGASH